MRSEERDRIRKRPDVSYNRKNIQERRNISSDVRPQHSRSNHRVETYEGSRHKKDERQKPQFSSVATKRSNERTRRDTSLGSRDRGHRNSPVELVYSGCRHTDSPSSSSGEENDRNADRRRKGYAQSRKRRHYEESVKELSARKKQIESELRALDEEEAAEAEKKKLRNHSNHQQHHHHQERQVDERIVRIKQVPDNDRMNNRNRRTEQVKRLVRVKKEPVSDDDNKNDVRSKRNYKKSHPPLHIKQERGHSSPNRRHRGHNSTDNSRRRNVTDDSRDLTDMEWGKTSEKAEKKEVKEKEKPNFETSGKLAEDTNTFNGVVIKYNEPSEARKPRRKWRLYPFKGDSSLPFIPVHRQSAYLLGRSRLIADIPIDHPSCSKQHAVLQFRLTPYTREDGTKGKSVRPYIIDLDSSNGTFINNKRIEPRRYMELMEKDVLKFGFSSRVYVILHEDSKNEEDNDERED